MSDENRSTLNLVCLQLAAVEKTLEPGEERERLQQAYLQICFALNEGKDE